MSDDAQSTASDICARGVVKHYESGRVRAVDGVDLEITSSEFVAICGPSGCGKTTLLNLIATVDRPDAGTLHVDGCWLTDFSDAQADVTRPP